MKNVKKYSLLFGLTIIMVLSLAVSANAAWAKVNKDSNIEYHFDEITGTLHIRGKGKIPDDLAGKCNLYVDDNDYEYDFGENKPVTGQKKGFSDIIADVKTVIIGEGITEIGHCSFNGYSGFVNMETAILPESLEKIGEYAFSYCKKLKTVNLPSNLKEIMYAAFLNTGIKNIVLPESLKKIEGAAFDWCDNLKKITFTNKVCSVSNCKALEEIIYPADFTNYNKNSGYLMATNCPNLKKITFPNIEKEHNIKIPTRSNSAFVKNCPKVKLGYVNFDMIKNLYVEYEVKTKSVSKLGKVTGLKHIQNTNDNKLVWNAVEGAGYYHVSHWNSDQKKWERVYGGADTYTTCISDGKYKVRAVNYDGEKYVYGKYSEEIEIHVMYRINLYVAEKGETSVKLKWSNTAGQTGYQLYYSTSKNSGYKKAIDTTTKHSYTVKNLEKGKTYYFKVRRYYKYADGNIAYGPFGDIVKVTL